MSILTRREALGLLTAGAALAQTISFPKGAIIRTLLRDVAPEEMAGGATLFHEHLQLGVDFNQRFTAASAAVRAANAPPNAVQPVAAAPKPAVHPKAAPGPDIMRDVDLMAAEVNKTKADNVGCIVDAGHADSGRDINFLRQVARKTSVHIVASGGYYAQPWYPKELATMSEDQLVRALLKQADEETLGAWGEIGSWDEMTVEERKVFRAVGRAQVATNIPIYTHTGIPGKAAIEQLNILEDQGVPPGKVVIGHLGNLVDPNVYVHKQICRRGAMVAFDRQGGNNEAQQVTMVMALLDAGFANNLMFSADASSGYAKTLTVFLPKLKAAGATDAVLHQIMYDNPRRFLAFVPKRGRRG
jgi:phosphotriesterase-related protein